MDNYIKISFVSQVIDKKKYKEFDSIRRKQTNKNPSLYSEKILQDYIYSGKLSSGRICKSCGINELMHYYPELSQREDKTLCENFEARHKYSLKSALNFIAETGGSIKEEILLNNITETAFNDMKTGGLIA